MTPDRIAAIVAAYGADPARWPPAERSDAEGAATAADLAEARAVDAAIASWLGTPVAVADDIAVSRAIDAALAAPVPRRWTPMAAGGALAAAIAAVAVFGTAQLSRGPSADGPVAVAAAPAPPLPSEDAALAALVFTPTPEEESLI